MFLLKFLVIFCVFAQTVLTKPLNKEDVQIWNNLIAPYNGACLIEANLSLKNIEAIISEQNVQETKEVGDYFKCLYLKLRMIKPDGEVDVDVLLTKAPYMTTQIAEKCKKAVGFESDLSKISNRLAACIVKSLSE
ncbi:hypothetical protein RN001_011382 [Aquatica leii]|uniref:Uncharacterized protein n=1 Tax=Aquatica leii TaxID=1421715 RepID=A0AAN7PB25_9COLE|nr:hypothetical protein RN001_011382 [Aquatica leii]